MIIQNITTISLVVIGLLVVFTVVYANWLKLKK